jgi:predicted permease
MIGDLEEEWHRRPPGPRRSAWFGVVALSLAIRYLAVAAAVHARIGAHAVRETGMRAFRRPGQTAVVVGALGIGIAAPSIMFSVTRGLTREAELHEPERLVHLGRRFTPRVVGIAPLDWLWPAADGLDGVESAGVFRRSQVDLAGGREHAARTSAAWVTPGVLRAFRVQAARGRSLTGDDADRSGGPVLVGDAVWRARFGSDPQILGATVRVDGSPRTVVGVMPPGFGWPGGAEVWLPLDPAEAREPRGYQAVARLADGIGLEVIREQVAVLNEGLLARGVEVGRGRELAAQSWRHHLIAAQDRRMMALLVALVGFVLVIACADVLNLLLARALARSRETAVRLALGSGPGRIVAGHLAEATLLSALGGAVGLGLTVLGVRVFEAQTAGELAHWMKLSVDLPVLLFGAALVTAAALGSGALPAWQAARLEIRSTLGGGAPRRGPFHLGRLSRLLIVGQIALSAALLTVAGLSVRGALTSLESTGEFATSSILAARYDARREALDPDEAGELHRAVVEAVEARSGVEAAALTSHLPGTLFFGAPVRVEVEGRPVDRPEDRPRIRAVRASPALATTLASALQRGRDLSWRDRAGEPAAVLVNEAFVREHLGDREPVGTRIRLDGGSGETGAGAEWVTVVGVVPGLGVDVGAASGGAAVYRPISTDPLRTVALLVRASPGTDPLSLLPAVRDAVADLDPDLALWDVDTLAGHIRSDRAVESVFAWLFLVFGLAGLLLAGVGLYGLLAFTVRRRTRELGVRMALGAAPGQVVGRAVGGGLVRVLVGIALGLAGAAAVAPLLGPALLGADPRDPLVYGIVAATLVLTGAFAAWNPARRALSTDVGEVLRLE